MEKNWAIEGWGASRWMPYRQARLALMQSLSSRVVGSCKLQGGYSFGSATHLLPCNFGLRTFGQDRSWPVLRRLRPCTF